MGKPKIKALVTAMLSGMQGIEDALVDTMTFRLLNGVGAQLDQAGKIVGQTRDGASDADYKLRIVARILATRSSGTAEDVYAVFRALGVTDMEIVDWGYAGFRLRIFGVVLTPAIAKLYGIFLGLAKGAGIYGLLQFVPDAGDVFTFDGGEGLGFDDVHSPGGGGIFESVVAP